MGVIWNQRFEKKPRPLIIIAEIQFQPGHERISTWKGKKRHFNWPGPFERKEVVKLKCRSNYSRDWRVFTHLLTSRRPCFCVPSVFEGSEEWTELGDTFSYQGIRWKYHNELFITCGTLPTKMFFIHFYISHFHKGYIACKHWMHCNWHVKRKKCSSAFRVITSRENCRTTQDTPGQPCKLANKGDGDVGRPRSREILISN